MASRADMIAALEAQDQQAPAPGAPTREQMIATLQAQDNPPPPSQQDMGGTERAVRAVGGAVAPYIAPIGRAVDRFTGAPVRAAIGAVQDGTNPVEAYASQFGEDPAQAPTGQEIAQKAGLGKTSLSDVLPSLYAHDGTSWKLRKGGLLDPTASGAAGLGVDVAADPLNLVGVGEVADAAKAVGKGAASAVGTAADIAAKGADIATGTGIATKSLDALKSIGQGTANVANSAKDALGNILKPSMAADAADMAKIADANNIPRDLMSAAHEFGDTSTITRLQRSIAEGSLGQKYLEAHNAGIDKTSEALVNDITSKFGHAPATAADAGSILQDAVNDHISKVFDDADMTYKSAASQFPGIQVDPEAMAALQSKAVGMQREAQRLTRTSADPTQLAQASNLSKWADIIQNAKGSYKEMSEIVQNVGQAAFGKTPVGQIPADIKKLKELYNTGSEALIQSVRNHSPEAADELVANNSDINEMLGDKSILGKAIQDPNPERAYSSLVKNGGSEQIETLEKILPPETFDQMRSKYLQDLVGVNPHDGTVKFGSTLNALQKNKDRLSYLFDPDELKNTADLLKFGDRYGSPVMSSSGTGASMSLHGIADKIKSALLDENSLNKMKSSARSRAPGAGGVPVNPMAAAGPATAATAAPLAQATASRPLVRLPGNGRSLLETELKAGQSVSPSTYTRPVIPGKAGNVGDAPQQNDAPPTKGPAKWANDGIDNLKEHVDDPAEIDDMKGALLSDPKGKQLLIGASDLKPGTKAMTAQLEKIRSRYGNIAS